MALLRVLSDKSSVEASWESFDEGLSSSVAGRLPVKVEKSTSRLIGILWRSLAKVDVLYFQCHCSKMPRSLALKSILSPCAATDVVVFVHLPIDVLRPWVRCQSRVNRSDSPHPSHLISGEAVHRLLSQHAVALAQPFPFLANGLMRLLLGCADNPVDPGLEVGGFAC